MLFKRPIDSQVRDRLPTLGIKKSFRPRLHPTPSSPPTTLRCFSRTCKQTNPVAHLCSTCASSITCAVYSSLRTNPRVRPYFSIDRGGIATDRGHGNRHSTCLASVRDSSVASKEGNRTNGVRGRCEGQNLRKRDPNGEASRRVSLALRLHSVFPYSYLVVPQNCSFVCDDCWAGADQPRVARRTET